MTEATLTSTVLVLSHLQSSL